jgi:tetratricopeptide (TPR) repeat protein
MLRAEAAEALGDEELALADLDAALTLDDDLAVARVNRAVILYRRAQLAAALSDMDYVISCDDSAEHRDNRSEVHRAMGNFDAAERDRVTAIKLRAA